MDTNEPDWQSTNTHLEKLIQKQQILKNPYQSDIKDLLQIIKEIEIALRGSKYNDNKGICQIVKLLEKRVLTLETRVLNPKQLKGYVKELIQETIEEAIKQFFKRAWKILSAVAFLYPAIVKILMDYFEKNSFSDLILSIFDLIRKL